MVSAIISCRNLRSLGGRWASRARPYDVVFDGFVDDPGDGQGEASSGPGASDARSLSARRALSRVGVLGAGLYYLRATPA